jgi:hypothetical protein
MTGNDGRLVTAAKLEGVLSNRRVCQEVAFACIKAVRGRILQAKRSALLV